jgi:hypothetical protein
VDPKRLGTYREAHEGGDQGGVESKAEGDLQVVLELELGTLSQKWRHFEGEGNSNISPS